MNVQIDRKNKYDEANFFSKYTFAYLWNFFVRNYGKEIRISDLERCPKDDRSRDLGDRLEDNWIKQLNNSKKSKPSLFWAMHRTFGWRYHMHGAGIAIVQCVLIMYQTIVMGWLVKELANVDDLRKAGEEVLLQETFMRIYINGFQLIALQGVIILFTHPYFFHTVRIGMDMRIATCHLVYKKSLKLSKSAMAQTTIGQIVNFLSNDVNRFDWLLAYPHYLFIGPLMTVIVSLILIYMEEFGVLCLPGIMILVLYIPFQGVLGKLFTNLREKTAALTDERVRITNEFVKAIKVIKMYAWEEPFCALINAAREKEVQMIKQASFLRGLNLGLFFVATKIIMFVMLFLYVSTGNPLNSGMVFVAMCLVNQLRTAVCLYVPYAISTGAEALISMQRIEKFLLMDEFKKDDKRSHKRYGKETTMKLTGVSTKYMHMQENLLSGINMDAVAGEVVAIIGPVGSGKSSVLMTLLGELPVTSGVMDIKGEMSYSSQEAWIVPGSIRDNIIFGSKYNLERYANVVKACCLETDFSLLPSGDKTIVGDTGLSGGQKARVNLARCLYKQADIYLLDDPLSAVDAHVGKDMFENAVKGFLKDKLVVLITHQLQFIKSADKILLLKHGSPQVYGDYAELLNKGFDFIKFNPVHSELQQVPTAVEESVGGGGGESNVVFVDIVNSSSPTSSVNVNGSAINSTTTNDIVIASSILPSSAHLVNSVIAGASSSSTTTSPVANRRISSVVSPHPPPFSRAFCRQSMSRTSVRSRTPSMRSNASSVGSHMSFRRRDTVSRTTSIRGNILAASPHDVALPISVVNEKLLEDFDFIGDVDDLIDNDGMQEGGGESFAQQQQASGTSYWVYMVAGGGFPSLFIVVMTMVVTQVLFTFSDWWLSVWTDYVEHEHLDNRTVKHPVLGLNTTQNINIYTIQTVLILVLAIVRTIIFFITCMRASVKLHDRLFRCLVRAPMSFFDNNPVGILLNRCSRDMGIIDDILPPTIFDAMSILLVDTGVAIMICFIDVWIILPTFLVLLISWLVRKLYVQTARGVKRLEGVTRSPVFTHLATSLAGVTTIRAFNAEERFCHQFDHYQDNHTAAWFHFISASRWFGVTLDWLCFVYITAITISMLAQSEKGSDVGLVITSAILLETGYQWAIRQLTEVDTQMTSVERVDEYAHLEPEGYLESSDPSKKPPKEWPNKGEIEFGNASLCYNASEGYVLHDLTFVIREKEKIGIVGRTGAGKSSIINALFRLIELSEGSIIIDGIDISTVGLHELRKKISIIPQEPVLFSGTIRRNLDPFNELSDGRLWRALDEVQLRETVQDIPKGLEAFTSEEMNHFSVGQRQLLCLARAILRQNKILILDEATANVDPKTDATIQQTIRTSFADCSVLTIAHRLDTIIDTDRVLVLDAGRVAEFDTPINLINNDEGMFASMVKATGKDTALKLRFASQRASDARKRERILQQLQLQQNVVPVSGSSLDDMTVTSNESMVM